MQVEVRRAREHDQAAITAMVRQARLNPTDLRWPRFTVADALLQTQASEVYTLIDRPYVDHFRRWGFHEVERAGLPRSVARVYRIGRVVTAVASLLTRRTIRIVPLRRTAT